MNIILCSECETEESTHYCKDCLKPYCEYCAWLNAYCCECVLYQNIKKRWNSKTVPSKITEISNVYLKFQDEEKKK